jgi:nicotinate phosphoribosyltransferase
VFEQDGRINVRVEGPWQDVILWEIPVLAIISEMRNRFRYPQFGVSQALERLDQKIDKLERELSREEMSEFNLIDFGTRRRFSLAVQDAVVGRLRSGCRRFAAPATTCWPRNTGCPRWAPRPTSGSRPTSSSASRWSSASAPPSPAGWTNSPTTSVSRSPTASPWMPSCATSTSSWRAATRLRHDSGDPVVWGEKAISHYQRLGIDPAEKTLVFSDGLNLDKAVELFRHFRGRINTSFGIGTKLTCDLPGVSPMNIVFKLMECNGGPVAKISDSPGKTLCRDADFIRNLKQAFHVGV